MDKDAEKRDWVTTVLGFRFPDQPEIAGSNRALDRFRAAMADVEAELVDFQKALLADPAIAADPRARFVAAAAVEIPNMLPRPGKLEKAIARSNTGPDGSEPALVALANYRKALSSAAALRELEAFVKAQMRAKLDVTKHLGDALNEIEQTLRAA